MNDVKPTDAQATPPTLLIPDYVIAAIEGYGLARATETGSYEAPAIALTEVFAQLRHWGAHLQAPLLVIDAPPRRPPPDAMTLLKAARHALRSYGFGNASGELASGIASDIEQFLARQPLASVDASAPVDLLDAAAAPRSELEASVIDARDIAEEAERAITAKTWRSGNHKPGKAPGLFQRRYFEGDPPRVCRWDGRQWWSVSASTGQYDPDNSLDGGISHHQDIEWRGPLSRGESIAFYRSGGVTYSAPPQTCPDL